MRNEFGSVELLQTFEDLSGNLTVFEPDIGFEIKRIYFLHGLSSDAVRGEHAHRELTQVMLAVAGSFTVEMVRGGVEKTVTLSSPREACLIPPLTWRRIANFTSDAVCLVLASDVYRESDYIRDRDEFDSISRL